MCFRADDMLLDTLSMATMATDRNHPPTITPPQSAPREVGVGFRLHTQRHAKL